MISFASMMKIVFALEEVAVCPIGGYKIVYEYANRLAMLGNKIVIVHRTEMPLNKRAIDNFFNPKSQIKWFEFSPNVKVVCATKYRNGHSVNSDIIVATGIKTVDEVYKLPPRFGRKVYFVQGYEIWAGDEKYVSDSYRKCMEKITISKGLKSLIYEKSHEKAWYCPNAIDHDVFQYIVPMENRNRFSICALYSPAESKGSKYLLEAIREIRSTYPKVELSLFGTCDGPQELINEKWVTYIKDATPLQIAELMNNSFIFVCSSVNEGFGLTAVEAMACGCALITTNHLGAEDYAKDEITALVVEKKSSKNLSDAVIRLFNDEKLAISISKQGRETALKFCWENSVEVMSSILERIIDGNGCNSGI